MSICLPKETVKCGNELAAFRAKQMIDLTKGRQIKNLDTVLVGKVLDHCVIHDKKHMDFIFLDGTQIGVTMD